MAAVVFCFLEPSEPSTGRKVTTDFWFLLRHAFASADYAAVFEDDVFPASDIVSYFEWGRKIMELDDNIFCISSWNDNSRVSPSQRDANKFFLGGHFMGLGWMCRIEWYATVKPATVDIERIWDSIVARAWPSYAYSIFPELARTLHVPRGENCDKVHHLALSTYPVQVNRSVSRQYSDDNSRVSRVEGEEAFVGCCIIIIVNSL